MAIVRLSLVDFRNHADLVIAPAAAFILLTGPNGAGKTNVLEALSLLAPGRGMRRAALAEIARDSGVGGFSVAARLEGDGGTLDLATGTLATAPDRRMVRINGASANQQALAAWCALTWVTPAMDRLFMEGAAVRRRFLDRLAAALDPQHGIAAARYDQALRERNRLLAQHPPGDARWLAAVEEAMAGPAAQVEQGRIALITQLTHFIAAAPDDGFLHPALTLTKPEPSNRDEWRTQWAATRSRDRAAARTLDGPHRADLVVTVRSTGRAASATSTGEQKAMLLAILLAHAELVRIARRTTPILLLDEVAAHLDGVRRAALFDRLDAAQCQAWITATEASPFAGLRQDFDTVAMSLLPRLTGIYHHG